MIIGFIIWTFVAILFLVIGLITMKSKAPVGFYTFVNPPQVKNVKDYNKAVSKLWIISAIVFEIIGIPLLFIEQNSPVAIVMVFGVLIWVFGLMLAYSSIENKYKNKS